MIPRASLKKDAGGKLSSEQAAGWRKGAEEAREERVGNFSYILFFFILTKMKTKSKTKTKTKLILTKTKTKKRHERREGGR